jgi:hypothetical protein
VLAVCQWLPRVLITHGASIICPEGRGAGGLARSAAAHTHARYFVIRTEATAEIPLRFCSFYVCFPY